MSTRKFYQLSQSPLYKLHSKKQLCQLLGVDLKFIKGVLKRGDGYNVFSIRQGKKIRVIEKPIGDFEIAHAAMFKLLRRIETPEYLHSGIRKRSHITNALAHTDAGELITLDIAGYYPSVNRENVYQLFNKKLQTSPDVACLLADLLTFDGHVPTGSPASQLLAFWSTSGLFDSVFYLALENEVTFTLYVDDLVFSSEHVSGEFLWKVKKLIRKYGFRYHKEHRYSSHTVKLVTGVAISQEGMCVRNKHHRKIYDLYRQHLDGGLTSEQLLRLKGMLASVSQYDEKYANVLRHVSNN